MNDSSDIRVGLGLPHASREGGGGVRPADRSVGRQVRPVVTDILLQVPHAVGALAVSTLFAERLTGGVLTLSQVAR